MASNFQNFAASSAFALSAFVSSGRGEAPRTGGRALANRATRRVAGIPQRDCSHESHAVVVDRRGKAMGGLQLEFIVKEETQAVRTLAPQHPELWSLR